MSTGSFTVCRATKVVFAAGLAFATAGPPAALADPGSPVAITNVDSPDPVASGAQLTYTITIVNTGGAKIDNVVLSDQLNGVGGIGVPPQLVLTSTRGSCTQSVDLVTCNAGTIEGGGTWTVTHPRHRHRVQRHHAQQHRLGHRHEVGAELHDAPTTATTLVSGGGGAPLPDLSHRQDRPDQRAVVVADDLHPDREQHRHRERDRRQGRRHGAGRPHRRSRATAPACSSAAWPARP